MKTRVAGSLPGIHEWEKYMSVDAVSHFPVLPMDSFLVKDDFGKTLMAKKAAKLPDFRVRCRQFIDRLILVLGGNISVTSGVSRCHYSFCPETLLEGDDCAVFILFADLCRLLKVCNLLTLDESSCAIDEFGSYVIEKRGQHCSSGQSACNIGDVTEYLIHIFSFQSQSLLLRVFKFFCLAVKVCETVYPSESISLSGSSLREDALQNFIRLVQSYVLSSGYRHQSFLLVRLWMLYVLPLIKRVCFLCVERLFCGNISLGLRMTRLCQFREIRVSVCCFSDVKSTKASTLNVIKSIGVLTRMEQNARGTRAGSESGSPKMEPKKSDKNPKGSKSVKQRLGEG